MQFKDRKQGDILIVKLMEKRLDASTAVDFKKRMSEFIDNGNDQIVLDLSEVDFMDSTGLGSIVSILKMIGRKGDLVLTGIRETQMVLLKLTRMDRVFQMFGNEEEAIAFLSK